MEITKLVICLVTRSAQVAVIEKMTQGAVRRAWMIQ